MTCSFIYFMLSQFVVLSNYGNFLLKTVTLLIFNLDFKLPYISILVKTFHKSAKSLNKISNSKPYILNYLTKVHKYLILKAYLAIDK